MSDARIYCQNPFCDRKANWLGNYALCTACQYTAAHLFIATFAKNERLANEAIQEGEDYRRSLRTTEDLHYTYREGAP